MFTGLIEEVGIITHIFEGSDTSYKRFRIACNAIKKGMRIGDSICVQGACQTVVRFNKNFFSQFWFEIESLHVTLEKTNFSQFNIGTPVNLETSMQGTKRFGGHIVTGHVQSTAHITKIDIQGENTYLYLMIPEDGLDFILEEGSIAVDGISLTIAKVEGNIIMINLISHTVLHTNMQYAKEGDIVNIEYDMIVKYLHGIVKKYHSV